MRTATKAALILCLSLFVGEMGHAQEYDFQTKSSTVELDAGYLPTMQNYDLSGSDGSFSTSFDGASGHGYIGGVKYNASGVIYRFEFFSITHRLDSPSGLTPISVNSELTRYAFTVSPKSSSAYGEDTITRAFNFEYGAEFRQRNAEKTTPSVFLTGQSSGGLRAAGTYTKWFGTQTYMTGRFGIFLPLYHEEQGGKTGYYRFSLNPDLGVSVNRKLGSDVEFGVGAWLLYEYINYSGTGTRSTTNATSKATETYTNVLFPITVKIKF